LRRKIPQQMLGMDVQLPRHRNSGGGPLMT
jgi:hypothetical protein